MKLDKLLVALTILCASGLQGQTQKFLEICGVPFHLGMTRHEVITKLVLPPGAREGDELLRPLIGGNQIVLFAGLFGLPKSFKCSGFLFFKQDRIFQIHKELASTTDAVALTRSLFLELRKLTEKGATAMVTTWNADEDGVSQQFIRFSFGEEAIQIEAAEGQINLLGETQKIGPVTTLSAVLSRE